ncbi:MAG: hypothetical protein MUP63_03295 [Candidatus Nanohaloarchaeota archaeon QJJ-7]|nr:hypothetical protein [Candidatus Nanohaloarchaeota archaeon QJJ-7]
MGCGSSPRPAEPRDRELFEHFRDLDVKLEEEEGEESTGSGSNLGLLVTAAVLSFITASAYILIF